MVSGGNDDSGANKIKKYVILGIYFVLFVAIVVGVALGVRHTSSKDTKSAPAPVPAPTKHISSTKNAIRALCTTTDYKETCVKSLNSSAGNIYDPKELIKAGFQVAINALQESIKNSTMLNDLAKDSRTQQALENCRELMDSSIDDLGSAIDRMGEFDLSKSDHDLRIWLSAAITFEESCLDEFENITGDVGEKMKMILNTSRELTRNGLDMITRISSFFTSQNFIPTNRRLLSQEGFPLWVNDVRHRLLAATPATIKADVVVAKDGSGKYKTIVEALNDVPKNNNKTFVIYIKAGVYEENIVVTKNITNVMFIGDGPYKTKITGNRNFVDGIQIMKTATVAVVGANFMAKDIGFENTAGAIKRQAVALRVLSHKSVFYNCLIDAYQGTLYAHAHGQFYRDCIIGGTVDFIFGDAAAVFQNCKMIIKKPLDDQQSIVTSQGRTKENAATGFVLQNCTITGEPGYLNVKDVSKGYLGRPWKEYSRTVIMQSQIDDVIQPEGWLPWIGDFALNTLWYGEYGNRGPGSVQTERVKWVGIKNLTDQTVLDFTIEKFIGDSWIKPTGVPYTNGMMNQKKMTKGKVKKNKRRQNN